ncbi:MAG: carbamoyltransferase HypF [Proteobacteria bacterium]|nr:carbamoyltransferase HypF [Pseudomonadota bacterium]MBU1648539.1 carbamoyltransferase HypF [Pseudomonadota bacterium]MBU1986707.1 carbamoyltransferase HypF [Pseudomonadota bacterium]
MTALSGLRTEPHSLAQERKGVELTIQGTVQGVGFRPFVYRLARDFKISGTIANTGQGVVILAEGLASDLDNFLQALSEDAPPLARISSISQKRIPTTDRQAFAILKSSSEHASQTMIPADIALCDDCRKELLDPTDRRYRYPFINCTNCGPRFTIVSSIPYDRPGTSMHSFPMCRSCQAEYDDPDNRRFHAQPNACPQCGPQISWHDCTGKQLPNDDPLTSTISTLCNGDIVAIRGLGGFHLVVDAGSEAAVALLRKRKQRRSRPLAIMVADLEAAGRICALSPMASETLTSPAHPIVLLLRKETASLAANLAPGMGEIGIMLPYTPLHHLLFATPGCPQALVMTSGNRNGEPLCTGNEEAISRLGDIADFFLLHNREIVTRIDDSVIRIMQGRPRVLRRARGYVPNPIPLTQSLPPLLACGSGLKNTFCLVRDDMAFISQHIGDLANMESLAFFKESIYHFQELLETRPQLVVCDLHPDYLSSRHGQELERELGLARILVQHHHAHAVAVMAEHGLQDKVLAIILDGTGLGPDGTIWGGEILEVTRTDFLRRGCLAPLPLPGGDAAAEQPWRMGLAALYHSFGEEGLPPSRLPAALLGVTEGKRTAVLTMMQKGFNSPLTSSCGRLFDAVAALLGIRLDSDFEGQAAMEVEAFARQWQRPEEHRQRVEEPVQDNGLFIIDSSPFIRRMLRDLQAGKSIAELAMAFHTWLIDSLVITIRKLAVTSGIHTVVLSGGCLQNRIIMEGLFQALEQDGFQVFTGRQVPVNDGGISLGQAVIGGLRYVSGNTHAGH